MYLYIYLWIIFALLSFGATALRLLILKWFSSKRQKVKIHEAFKPKISIIVPTHNESEIIQFKLRNLSKIDYPQNSIQMVFADDSSQDNTPKIINDFIKEHPELNAQLIVRNERRGKSAVLNYALKHCNGEIVIISDADCLWKPNILREAIPYMSDQEVGAISGPQMLLNPNQSSATKTEESYLKVLHMTRLGESNVDSTLFFEGGFSAYKKSILNSFDPYNTGSDDNGTVIYVLENNMRTLFVPEAEFFTIFPLTWKERISLKIRRATQLSRVLTKYLKLLLNGKLKRAKTVVVLDLFTYLLSPIFFWLFSLLTLIVLLNFPIFAVIFLTLVIPKIRASILEAIIGFSILSFALVLLALNKTFAFWQHPESRALFTEELLIKHELI